MTFDGTCERGGFQRAPQEIEKIPPECNVQHRTTYKYSTMYYIGVWRGVLGPLGLGLERRERSAPAGN
jgi:hypothetical protein